MLSSENQYSKKSSKKDLIEKLAREFSEITIKEAVYPVMEEVKEVNFESLIVKEIGEQSYEYDLRKKITLKIQQVFGDFNYNNCVVLGFIISKKIWLGVEYSEEIEELLKIIIREL